MHFYWLGTSASSPFPLSSFLYFSCISFCHCIRRAAFHSSVAVSNLKTAEVEIFVFQLWLTVASVMVSRAVYGALIGRFSPFHEFNCSLYISPKLKIFTNVWMLHPQEFLNIYLQYSYRNNISLTYFISLHVIAVLYQCGWAHCLGPHSRNHVGFWTLYPRNWSMSIHSLTEHCTGWTWSQKSPWSSHWGVLALGCTDALVWWG